MDLLTEVAVSALFAGVGLFLQAPIVATMATKKSSFFIENQTIRMVLLNKNILLDMKKIYRSEFVFFDKIENFYQKKQLHS